MLEWRYIENSSGSAAWNMAVDEALLRSFKEDDRPILRLYQWEEPTLSFGRFSYPKEMIEWDWLQKKKIPYVRRVTGGGILVHGGDISYSLIVPRSFVKNRGVKESYRYLCGFLIRLYKILGIDAAFACDLKVTEKHSDICLAGTEAYDILTSGRKIGGNAQRHTRQALLQHGTVPLILTRELFEMLFLENSGLAEAATLEDLGIDISYHTLTESLKEAFKDTFDATLYCEGLRKDELSLAQTLLDDKYTREAWNVHAEDTSKQA